jgi:hypothetical protein
MIQRDENWHWDLINSNDPSVWSIAKHRSAAILAEETEDKGKLAKQLWDLFLKTNDRYYAELSKQLKKDE